MNKLVRVLFALLLVAGCSKQESSTTPLTIETQNGQAKYTVEEANTREEMETGLMNRDTLAADHGMIFNIDPVRRVAMWMKDTKMPLDMIFIAPDGTITQVYENAEAMSEYKIVSQVPVRAVIEINAGDVKKHQIKVGNKVSYEFFKQMNEEKAEAARAEEEKAPIMEEAEKTEEKAAE